MRALSPVAILDVWERGSPLRQVDRALLLLRHACPEAAHETLAALSLGRRDALLLKVREHTFGDRLEAYTECPGCGERLEFSCSCRSLLSETPPQADGARTVAVQGRLLRLRCPDSRDAAAAAISGSVEAARRLLLSRCVSLPDATDTSIDSLPEPVQTAIAASLAAADPHAEILFDLSCPACGHAWQAILDIVSFLWSEIRARARRLLQEIDLLARTYGWTEAEILGMSDVRRGLYLQMAMS